MEYNKSTTFDGEPLKDLDGNVITEAGWYDFTRRYDSEDGTSVGDGGEFIYANYMPVVSWWQVDTDIRNFIRRRGDSHRSSAS